MAKPFRLTYQAPPPYPENFKNCLFDILLIVDSQTKPSSTRIQIKVVNICEMHGTEELKFWCYALFDRFQRYVETVREKLSDAKVLVLEHFIRQCNDFKSTR